MHINGYVLGTPPLLSPCSLLTPLAPSSLPSLPMDQAKVVSIDIERYLLGSPPPVGATFSVPSISVGTKLAPLAPSLLPSLQMDQVNVMSNGH